MFVTLSVVYVLVCLFLILVVLLQTGKGGGMGAAFGGAGQSVFGGAGAGNFLTKLTAMAAFLFMLLSATLAYMSSSSDKAFEESARTHEAREKARRGGTTKAKAPAAGPMSTEGGEQGATGRDKAPSATPTKAPSPH